MKMRFVLLVMMVVWTAGCASTQSPSAVNQLQIKVAHLERSLEEKDQEIQNLKFEMSELTSQMEGSQAKGSDASQDYEELIRIPSAGSSKSFGKDMEIIRVNASAEDVQLALKNAGYYEGKVDGKLGDRSKKAIGDFQKDHNLESDGVIGQKTWSELKRYLK